jgi:hypothetical protein
MIRSAEYEICCSLAAVGDVGSELSAPRAVVGSWAGATADDEFGIAADSDIIKRQEEEWWVVGIFFSFNTHRVGSS